MLKVTKTLPNTLQGNLTTIHLQGEIDEASDLSNLIGPLSGDVAIHCREVSRINSSGVVAWMKYFNSSEVATHSLRFFECSAPLVEQINLFLNFVPKGSVQSLFLHFSCPRCKTEFRSLFEAAALQRAGDQIPSANCNQCGAPATFDDVPERYLAFLKRLKV